MDTRGESRSDCYTWAGMCHYHTVDSMRERPEASFMKRLILPFLLTPILAACGDPIGAPISQLAGWYRSSVLVVPAPADGPDSAHLRGDYIDLRLYESGGLEATLVRSSVSTGGARSTRVITTIGTYTVRHDSVFMQTTVPCELNMEGWRRNGRNIEIDLGIRGPFHIVLNAR